MYYPTLRAPPQSYSQFLTHTNPQANRGLHETVYWYDMCRFRGANRGLYIADQDLDKGSLGYVGSERTRQNDDGKKICFLFLLFIDFYAFFEVIRFK